MVSMIQLIHRFLSTKKKSLLFAFISYALIKPICIEHWWPICGDFSESLIILTLPLIEGYYRPQRTISHLWSLWETTLPYYCWWTHCQRPRLFMEILWFLHGWHYLRLRYHLVIRVVETLQQLDSEDDCVPRHVTLFLRYRCGAYDYHPLQKTHWLLGQWPQMEKTRRQTQKVWQH